ncbi:hypothetical protein JOB18_041501 [Solea senegalensis]|uniref:Uncharacterized protein n=1 Tax=Solea senegalensis TaxID=28829 RepID=A0AAV6SHG7_SOLSE|nr:hypothetical protein JOB18_041501 [Solea senegalensis]
MATSEKAPFRGGESGTNHRFQALHADIVEDLSMDGFLKAYQRFTALRGHPRKLWSDQGTNFVGAKPVLKELYEFLNNINKDLYDLSVLQQYNCLTNNCLTTN